MYLVRQKRKNGIYYYAVEKKRIAGKVMTVKQIYLGSSETVINKLTDNSLQILKSKTFGSVALLLHIEKQFGLEKIFNDSLDKKRKNDVSGKYFLSILFNRILEPTSKAGNDK